MLGRMGPDFIFSHVFIQFFSPICGKVVLSHIKLSCFHDHKSNGCIWASFFQVSTMIDWTIYLYTNTANLFQCCSLQGLVTQCESFSFILVFIDHSNYLGFFFFCFNQLMELIKKKKKSLFSYRLAFR